MQPVEAAAVRSQRVSEPVLGDQEINEEADPLTEGCEGRAGAGQQGRAGLSAGPDLVAVDGDDEIRPGRKVAVGRPDPDAAPAAISRIGASTPEVTNTTAAGGYVAEQDRRPDWADICARASVLVLAEGNRERKRSAERGPGGSRRCPVVRSLRELHEGCIRGRRQVDGTCYAGCVSKHPGVFGFGWVVRAQSLPTEGSPAAKVFLPAGLGALRPLRRPVRSCPCDWRPGSPGARTYR